MKSSKRKRETAPAAKPADAAPTAAPVKASSRTAAAVPAPADQPSSTVIALASHCSVKDAAALKASLVAVFDERDVVTLDVGAIERIDTATMQLLCAFVRDRDAGARTTVWSGESKALREAAKLLGAGVMLALPETGVAA
jgi:ABC-type transporter Mla MlaB component